MVSRHFYCHKAYKYPNYPDLDAFRKHIKQNLMNSVFWKSFLEIFYIYSGAFEEIPSPQSHWTLTNKSNYSWKGDPQTPFFVKN